jgi:hypothetical protein
VPVDLTVPSGARTASPGGLLVAVQWPVMDAGYDLDLYLYRAGDPSPVASSTSMRAPDTGICLVDVEAATLTRDRTSPLSSAVPGTCDAANHVDAADPNSPGSPYFAMGIAVGAADIYPWYIADQYLDIAGRRPVRRRGTGRWSPVNSDPPGTPPDARHRFGWAGPAAR